MMIVPASKNESCNPRIVTTGIKAFLTACLQSAAFLLSPFARAVRTKSSLTVSKTAERVTRAKIAACGNAKATAGKTRDFSAAPKPISQPANPPAENQPSLTEKNKINRIANQKFGTATPSCAKPIIPVSAKRL